MLTKQHQQAYSKFYSSTHNNEFLDAKTETLIGLAASIATDCLPCTNYYLQQAQKNGITKGEISEVLAKVMAIAAGQKRLQTEKVFIDNGFNFDEP